MRTTVIHTPHRQTRQQEPHERMSVVKMSGVGKRYGENWAIRNINLELHAGDVLGFIGPNGAGKTTLMKLMAGLSRATTGEISVLGTQLDGRSPRTPDGVGLVMEHIGFIPYLTGQKNLEALAQIRGVADSASIRTVLETVGLDPTDNRPVRAYSLGMRQRLGLAQAVMERPRLLLLDEPTNGLDPAGIVDLRHLLNRLAETGVTIFLASHLLTEVERVCDRVLLVRQGEVVREIVPAQERLQVKVAVSDDTDVELLRLWAQRADVRIERSGQAIERPTFLLDTGKSTPQIVRELVDAGINIEAIQLARQTLEEAFMELVEQKDS